jgi:hypothetical protein
MKVVARSIHDRWECRVPCTNANLSGQCAAQVAAEALNPEILSVLDAAFALFVAVLLALGDGHARQSKGKARVAGSLARVDFIDIEGRIGQDLIALVQLIARIVVVGDVLLDVAFETVDGQIHLGKIDGGFFLLVATVGDWESIEKHSQRHAVTT